MALEIHRFAALADNYGFLLHDTISGETACIDTPDAHACLEAAAACGWHISQIWNTHWHEDHAGGNEAIKAATGARITAPIGDAHRIAGVDRKVDQGDTVTLGAWRADVLNVGGHTMGHVAYFLPEAQAAFVGDSLFALGCGRMFEGTPAQFWASLLRLRALPGDTMIYCAHEYSAANTRFALHADSDNALLKAYADEIIALRSRNQPTVPFALSRECATNPFLRADVPDLQARWPGNTGQAGDAVATFAALREAKNRF